MPSIVTNGYGYLNVKNIAGEFGSGPDKVVSVKTGSDPADLTRWQAFQLIEEVVKAAGLGAVVNEETGEITILKPESPAVTKRKDGLAKSLFETDRFSILGDGARKSVEMIISLEKKLGIVE